MPTLAGLSSFPNVGFPDRSITDPAKKTAAWIAQHCWAGVSEFNRAKPWWKLWGHDDHVADNIRYATGTQDTQQYRRYKGTGAKLDANSIEVTNRDGHFDGEQYVPRSGGNSGPTDPLSLDSIINAQPLPVLPVKLQALKTLIKQNYETNITALGQKAKKEKADHEAELRLWMDFGPDLQQMGVPQPEGMPDPMPQTEPELQTYLSTWQVGAAADLELKIQITDVESDIEQLMDEVADDLLSHGYGGLFDYYRAGKRTLTKRILPTKGIFLPTSYPDYRDMEMGGVLETVYLGTLLAEASNNRRTCNAEGKEWTKDDRAQLKQLAATSIPRDMQDSQLGESESAGSVQVVRYYFRTDDEWSPDKGAKADAKVDEKGRLLINCLYEATLICGTNLAYNCRKVQDQGRDLHNPLKARLPFALFATPATNGEPTSIVRRVKGIVDEMERSWRGYMADMRTYVPEGYNVQLRALQTMVEGMKLKGDNAIMEAYEFFRRTGDTFADLVDEDKQQIGTAAQKNPTGIPLSAQSHLSNLLQQLNLLEAMTGANAVVSAATPGSEQGKGVSQIALQGAANVMSFARTGLKKVYENHAKNLAGRIWATDAEIPVTGTVPGPDSGMREVGPRKDFHEYAFHMRVELGPTQEEWQELYQKADAYAAGPADQAQITAADAMYIRWLRNLKTAQRYLVMAVRRKAREDQGRAEALQKQNGDVQTQTAQAAAAAQQETDAKKHQQAMELAAFQRETAWGGIDRQTAAQDRAAERAAQAKVQVAEIGEMGNATRKDADHQHEAGLTAMQHNHEQDSAVLSAALAPPPPVPG